jgi:MFS family permease
MNNRGGHDAYAVLKITDFRWFIMGRFFLTLAIQMQSVIIGWQIYEITHDALYLGIIGLAEVIPFLVLALFAGHVADSVIRKRIILITNSLYVVCATGLLFLSYQSIGSHGTGLITLYWVIALTGVARAFFYPAQSAYMAQIVPKELYSNSSTWNSTIWHIAAVTGPALGGLIYGFVGIHVAYTVVVLLSVISLALFSSMHSKPLPERGKKLGVIHSLVEGLQFVFRQQLLLGAMTLDMFAVLFGGAIALLPIFAAEVLHVGPQGLGILRAAPAFGAVIMSFILAYYPPVRKTGIKLFFGVAGFGLCMFVFAVSRNFYLSLVILVLSGVFDNISVVIRGTIMQIFTPDEMRGRVASVNSIFIGSSNELGSFESGLAARLLGLVPSVIFGSAMTLLVVGFTARFAPRLRTLELEIHKDKKIDLQN